MSTKTSIKRIAAVAAVALTLGGFSAVSARADDGSTAVVAAAVAQKSGTGDAGVGGIAGPANSLTVTLTKKADGVSGHTNYFGAFVTVTGGAILSTTSGDLTVAATGASATVAASTTATQDIVISTPTVGSIVVNVYNQSAYGSTTYASTAAVTKTITVSSASVVGVLSVANSTSYITDSSTVVAYTSAASVAGASLSADATVLKEKGTSAVAMIQVRLKDTQATPAVIAAATLSASVSGSGLIAGSGSGTTTLGSAGRVATSTTDSSGYAAFKVYGDNTSGVGTVTITYTSAAGVTTTVSTETFTFYSTTVASVTATQILKVGSSAGARLGANAEYTSTTTKPAFVVALKDANGNLIAGGCSSLLITSSATTVFSATAAGVTPETDAAGVNGAGYCDVDLTSVASASGSTSSITAYVLAADGVTKISSEPMTFAVGGTTAYSATLTPGADSYAPGEKVTLTATLKDKSGNAVADGSYNLFADPTAGADAAAVLTPSASITTNPFASTTGNVSTVGGVATATFFAPYSSGAVTLSGTTGETGLAAALQGTTIAATVTIVNPADASAQAAIDAAQEATDAANAAYDAANNAMDSADAATAAAQDAADNASAALAAVTSLSATVAKLVKSVAAIAAALAKVQKKIGA